MKMKCFLLFGMIFLIVVGFVCGANYPAPFVNCIDNSFSCPNDYKQIDGMAVVCNEYSGCPKTVEIKDNCGIEHRCMENIKSSSKNDIIQAGNIQTDLQSSMGTTGGTTTTGGDSDSFKIERTSTKFNLGDNISTLFSSFDEDELPNLLSAGKYIDNDNDEFDFTQKITVGSNVQLSMYEDDDGQPVVGFKIPSGKTVLTYSIDFSDFPFWSNLPSTNLTFIGENYIIQSISEDDIMILSKTEEDFLFFRDGQALYAINSGNKTRAETFLDLKVNLIIVNDSNVKRLSSIKLIWIANEDLFVTKDSDITMPGFEAVKLSLGGLNYSSKNLPCNGFLFNNTCYENNSTFESEKKNYSIVNGSMHELIIKNDSLEDFKFHKENNSLIVEDKKSFWNKFLEKFKFW